MITNFKLSGADSSKNPGHIDFGGCEAAVLFSRECEESLRGELENLFYYDGDDGGFACVSLPNKPWGDTIWSRDMGVLLRELTLWGYTEHAVMLTAILLNISGTNSAGYHSFTDHLLRGEKLGGDELDGICAVSLGMIMLLRRLPSDHPLYNEIEKFLTDEKSPVRYIIHAMGTHPLIPGSGEFGGGMDASRFAIYYNSVQNQLCILTMRSMANWLKDFSKDMQFAEQLIKASDTLEKNMLKYLVDSDGTWIWCVDAKTLLPDEELLASEATAGLSLVNGVISMAADAYGYELPDSPFWEISRKTIQKLLTFPLRREQYDKYNMWTQFNILHCGLITGASYSQGYTSQASLLLDDMEMATRLLDYLAKFTFTPVEGHVIERKSPYWFYERMFSPDVIGKEEYDEGCGALNTVNVAEPLKTARIILGLDDINPEGTKLVPRLPDGWNKAMARRWTVLSNGVTTHADIEIKLKENNKLHYKVSADKPIDLKVINRKTGKSQQFKQVDKIDVIL